MLFRAAQRRLCTGASASASASTGGVQPGPGTLRFRNDEPPTLFSEVATAMRVTKRLKKKKGMSKTEREEARALLRTKRLELQEQGREIPPELLGTGARAAQRKIAEMMTRMPGELQDLRTLAQGAPERRKHIARSMFCTDIHRWKTSLHPVALEKWWDLLKAAPAGVLRHHLRELVPILEDRKRAALFHHFYESTDPDVLARRGYVVQGRDGTVHKLTREELRLARMRKLERSLDPRAAARMRFAVQRRVENRSERLKNAPTFRPFVYSEGDALAYLAYRTHAMYAVLLRVFGEVIHRVPAFAPRSMLDFGAGFGTAIFVATELWKGIDTPEVTPRTKGYVKTALARFLNYGDGRHCFNHPSLVDRKTREALTATLNDEVRLLEQKVKVVSEKVEAGLLPSGSEVEVSDKLEEVRSLLAPELWAPAWLPRRHDEAELDEEFMGEGMYAGAETKPFEDTDYFLEKDHSEYAKPPEVKALEERGLSPNIYINWFKEHRSWAGDYYKHTEKKRMERDPAYRPFSALQYLNARASEHQPDGSLASEDLHADEPEGALVYSNWEKREAEILRRITAIEPSTAMQQYGFEFLASVAPATRWKRFLAEQPDGPRSDADTHDLVSCVYTLSELTSEQLRQDVVRQLWESCTGVLVIVEAGTPSGFKLVLEARNLILEEYKGVGPWEGQPAVLAPCPHDNLECPVAYSLRGLTRSKFRTCAASAAYRPSSVQRWVQQSYEGFNPSEMKEPYSYCVIARNDVIPQRAVQQAGVPKYDVPRVSSNPYKMKDDPRLLDLLKKGIRSSGTRMPRAQLEYPPEPELTYPKTERNMSPFVMWSHRTPVTPKDLLCVREEVADYRKTFRDRSWLWSRVVEPPKPIEGGTQLVACTPHGSLEVLSIRKSDVKLKSLLPSLEAGSLVPQDLISSIGCGEYLQGDEPNTFKEVLRSLPLLQPERYRAWDAIKREPIEGAEEKEEEAAEEEEEEEEMSDEELRARHEAKERRRRAAEDPEARREMEAEFKQAFRHRMPSTPELRNR